MLNEDLQNYLDEMTHWQQTMDANLRKDDGWLSLVGLDWLEEGINTIGSAADNQIVLPPHCPAKLGFIDFSQGIATLTIETEAEVTVDAVATKAAVLRDDNDPDGPSIVRSGSVSFTVIKRGAAYGIRVRDSQSAAITQFTGRKWFPIDNAYHVVGNFVPHPSERSLQIINSVGMTIAMPNPGYVEFELQQQRLKLEAIEADETQFWFIFKDGTSGTSSYGAGRFLYSPRLDDGKVLLDFNRAYNPPCVFTPYATCPLAPKENSLSIPIMAGELI